MGVGVPVPRKWSVPWARLFVPLLLLCWGYALITPFNGAPDENAHTIQAAAVVRGHILMTSADVPPGEPLPVVNLPAWLTSPDVDCWRFEPGIPATCAEPSFNDDATSVPMSTSAQNYPPLYYLLVGWPTLLIHNTHAFHVMRLVSGALFAAISAAGLVALGTRRRRDSVLGLIALTPVAVFCGGGVNPQSLEYALGILTAGFLLPLVRPGHGVAARLTGGAISAAALCLVRPNSALWALFILLMVVAAIPVRRWWAWHTMRQFWAALAMVAGGGLIAVIWLYLARQSGAVDVNANPSSVPALWDFTWTGLVEYLRQAIGTVGWLDVPMVDLPFLLIVGTVAGLWFVAVTSAPLRRSVVLMVAMLAMPFISIGVHLPTISTIGIIWQGRYILSLLIVITLAAISWVDAEAPRRSVPVVLAVWLFVQTWVFITALRRFWVGLPGSWRALPGAMPWQAWAGLGLFGVGVVVLVVQWVAGRLSPARDVPGSEAGATSAPPPAADSPRAAAR